MNRFEHGFGKAYPLYSGGAFHLICYNKLGIVHIIYIQLKLNFVFWVLGVLLANSVDPDEMPHYAAFRPGLHCV